MKNDKGKMLTSPRLYVEETIEQDAPFIIQGDKAHYLRNVLRAKSGDAVRLFDGRTGEHLFVISDLQKGKADLSYERFIEPQPEIARKFHLAFVPIRKHRQDWLIEKAVELGVTDLHPVSSDHGQIPRINDGRINTQIIEAAEQCERLDLPRLHEMVSLTQYLSHLPDDTNHYACLERLEATQATALDEESRDQGVFIGPEGGFSPAETKILAQKMIPLSLGPRILRSETAAIKALIMLGASD